MFKFMVILISLFFVAKLSLILLFVFTMVRYETDEVSYATTYEVVLTEYFAIAEELGDDNWQDFITITVCANGLVQNVELNGLVALVNTSRRTVAQSVSYEAAFGYNFYEQASALERELIGIASAELATRLLAANQDLAVDFDTTTFADLADIALASAPVETGMYIDGLYHSIGRANAEGFEYFVNLFVTHGRIVAVHFNAINQDGVLKYDPLASTVGNSQIISWRNQATTLELALIDLQDPATFTFDEAGLATEFVDVEIEIADFVFLATSALAAGPVAFE